MNHRLHLTDLKIQILGKRPSLVQVGRKIRTPYQVRGRRVLMYSFHTLRAFRELFVQPELKTERLR